MEKELVEKYNSTKKNILQPKKRKKLELVKNWQYYLMMVPVIVVFFLFAYLPFPGILLAFKKYTVTGGILGSPWVGFDNFKAFFSGTDIWRIVRNILLINAGKIIFGMSCAILCALLLNELFSNKSKKVYQNILFLPTFFSALLVSKFFNLLLNNDSGIINNLLNSIGLTPIKWYDNPWYWIPIITIADIWKGMGNGMIIYYASIIGIDESLYESAQIDGATRRQQMFRITLPMIKPVIITQFLLTIGGIFNGDFLFIYSFIGDNYKLKETLDIIETFLFNTVVTAGTGNNAYVDYGTSTAIGLFQSLMGLIVVFSANFIVKLKDKDLALF